MFSGLIYLFAFLLVLSIVVVVHEGGHFVVARLCGVKVTDFSLGFGKTLWKRTDKQGTCWRICAVPMGGYVKMLGDEDAASAHSDLKKVNESDRKYTFLAQPLWKRASIIFAGPAMNYLFALFLLTGILWVLGDVRIPPVIGKIMPDSPAEQALLQPGDKFLKINDRHIKEYTDIQRAVRLTQYGKPLELFMERNGETFSLTLMPTYDEETEIPMIGIMSSPELMVLDENIGILGALTRSSQSIYHMTVDTLVYLKQILFDHRSAKELRGPVGIAEASGDAFRGGALSLLFFIAQISVALGLMNLLPVPILDGGHLAFYAVEAVIRRPLPDKIKNAFLWGGLSLLLFLMVYTLFLDIPRIFQRLWG